MTACSACGRRAHARGLCPAHYLRLRRTGSVGTPLVQSYGAKGCSVDGCDNPHMGRGYCGTHYMRARQLGDAEAALTHGRRSVIAYNSAHDRVRRERGAAKLLQCGHCGEQAHDWAYDHADASELTDDRGRPYSVDPNHYAALCIPCHRKWDS